MADKIALVVNDDRESWDIVIEGNLIASFYGGSRKTPCPRALEYYEFLHGRKEGLAYILETWRNEMQEICGKGCRKYELAKIIEKEIKRNEK